MIGNALKKAWIPLLILAVALVAGFTVQRVRTYFGQNPVIVTPRGGLPELNARDEREIERDLADMMHSVAMANYAAPGEKEDAEALEAALRFAMVQAKRMAKKKYTPRKYRKDE